MGSFDTYVNFGEDSFLLNIEMEIVVIHEDVMMKRDIFPYLSICRTCVEKLQGYQVYGFYEFDMVKVHLESSMHDFNFEKKVGKENEPLVVPDLLDETNGECLIKKITTCGNEDHPLGRDENVDESDSEVCCMDKILLSTLGVDVERYVSDSNFCMHDSNSFLVEYDLDEVLGKESLMEKEEGSECNIDRTWMLK